ncbi:LamG-like jellyroll fold domain-containing protein [Horticoccus sp. 23ND18S-11]|uniref:LamG-like jellyroll fold domain-containing protein n=1 Tax=Horticoccus sp. 23ND18S-11 TaxID=3391832 RepID=UPI0039C8C24C
MHDFRLSLPVLVALLAPASLAAATPNASPAALRDALTFHAAFDGTADATLARGDRQVYTAAERTKREAAAPGLPAEARIARGEGRFGDALEFRGKTKAQVFYHGGANLGYKPANWSGSVSFWMRLDPEKDLEPGYCDPFQFVAQAWNEGNLFVEFSKDHTPRHFRFGIMAVTKYWNPQNRKYEEMPDAERPIAPVHQHPFRRDRWTHVLVTFANINSGTTDGRGTLYLDGKRQAAMSGWNHTFNWDVTKSALTLGLNYTGFLDDFAIFDRELTADEVTTVFTLPRGVSGLHATP